MEDAMQGVRRWLLSSVGREGDAADFLTRAHELEAAGDLELAATAYDRAYARAPEDETIAQARRHVLDQLAVTEHGLTFRYVPAGSFLMGYSSGEPDERPVHVVELSAYWLSDAPMSWVDYCDLMGWQPAPIGLPPDDGAYPGDEHYVERLPEPTAAQEIMQWAHAENRIRLQYCEDETLRARDWHAHAPEHEWLRAGQPVSSRRIFGEPERADPTQPWTYRKKPMVAVSWQAAQWLGQSLSTDGVTYRLPTEAEWEKAARGGVADALYPWGDAPPTADRCDFDRFERFSIQPSRTFPPNGYGLYSMSGGVWEWTNDWYDAMYYVASSAVNPSGPEQGEERVLRGGSWADCGEVLRVSFRSSARPTFGFGVATVGFRLCRVRTVHT
jgi:sulfatase modifying factor 1